jgi:hypothetical protein
MVAEKSMAQASYIPVSRKASRNATNTPDLLTFWKLTFHPGVHEAVGPDVILCCCVIFFIFISFYVF